ncbi:DegT/DnrJ/EryC1/StrS family aminotransferase [Marinivivus vitaminiproducens]|uniref:DegT/DnrJ/EryC1/StrS family aminotransferase n=1 Tax=Marinivivus vitaminiproducens TaxID=3035935 RepID=UPI0027AAABF6|nr:DegT/DnrJ/EryC1/StrS family aminotransferase [Geminicoccaceae bacterium SCSIO 64248]
MQVPFFAYPKHFLSDEDAFVDIFRSVMARGAFIQQQELLAFEANLAGFIGTKHAIGLADGTNALILGLRALGIGTGDEVIFPSHTFVATHGAIVAVGATPVPVDMGEDGLMDPGAVEAAITSRTRMILPVQLNGRICAMERILEIARQHGLLVAEDSCQALGARLDGCFAGTFGTFGAFSFYPAKALGCFGDGGALVTDSDEIARQVRAMRDHGRNERGEVVMSGTNARLDNLQAAILDFKLKTFRETIARRRDIAGRYDRAFREIEGMVLPPAPDSDPRRFDTFQNYELCAVQRDALRAHLGKRGIGTMVQWGGRAVHQIAALGHACSLPRTERFFEYCLMLPMNQYLTDAQVDHVIGAVREFHGHA